MKNVASIKIKRQQKINKYANNLLKRYSLKGGINKLSKVSIDYFKKIEKAKKSTNLTYSKLEVFNYSELKKMGYTNKAIYNKLNAYYRNKGNQLMLDRSDTKTMSKLIRSIKRTKSNTLPSGRKIVKTERSTEKYTYNFLKQIVNKTKPGSWPHQIMEEYENGWLNFYQLKYRMEKFSANAGGYLDEKNGLNNITYIVEGYNDELVK